MLFLYHYYCKKSVPGVFIIFYILTSQNVYLIIFYILTSQNVYLIIFYILTSQNVYLIIFYILTSQNVYLIIFYILTSQNVYLTGHHECEIFGRGLEAAESATRWRSCQKNPGHNSFIPATDFADHRLLRSLSDESREWLKVAVDRTVRLRVNWTSPDRPDDDDLSDYRGTDRLRLGTGFIRNVSDPQLNKPCPCDECDGKVKRNYWEFKLQTAHHVVYNREEAKETQVDLFYDEEDSQEKGQMKTVRAMTIVCSHYDRDFCGMTCITHDEDLGNRLLTLEKRWWGLFYTSRQPVSGLNKERIIGPQ